MGAGVYAGLVPTDPEIRPPLRRSRTHDRSRDRELRHRRALPRFSRPGTCLRHEGQELIRGATMNWSQHSIPAMQLEARFGDRVVPAFCERPKSIWAMVSAAAARNPDGEALVCGAKRMTWREVAQQSAQIAAGLRKLGLQSGDRVALLLGNRIEFVLAMFAAANLGTVTVLLSTRQQKPEIAYVLADCGARLLIHEATLADRLPDARDVPDLIDRISVDDDARASQFSGLAGNDPVH